MIKAFLLTLLFFLPAKAGLNEDASSVFSLLYEGRAAKADSAASRLCGLEPANPFFAYLRSLTLYDMGAYAHALEQANLSLANLPAIDAAVRDRVLANKTYLEQATPVLSKLKQVEGDHFIYFYSNPKDSILAPEVFAVLEAAYDTLGRDLGYRPLDKIRIEAYPDRASFITVSTLTEDEVNRTGTIALCKFNRMLFVSPRALQQGYEWKTTLCHEYVHFIINRVSLGRLPLWLHEGMAHFEEVRYNGTRGGELTLLEKDMLYRAVKNNAFVAIPRMHPSFAKLKDEEESGLAFAEVRMAMNLVYNNGGYARFRSILALCAAEGNLDSALGGVDKFEQQLFNFIRQEHLSPVEGISVIKREFSEDSTADESFLFRKYVRLADMLLERRRLKAAIREMERADETGKRHSAWIINQIGLLLEKNGEPEKALKMFDQSILLFPEYCNGYFNRARAVKEGGNVAAALRDAKAAIDLNPFHLPARELCADLLLKSGKAKEAAGQKRVIEFLQAKGL